MSAQKVVIGLGVLAVIVVIIVLAMKKKGNEEKTGFTSKRSRGIVSPMMSKYSSCGSCSRGTTKYTKYNSRGQPLNSNGKVEGFLDTYMTNVPDPKTLQFSDAPLRSPYTGFLDDTDHAESTNWDNVGEIGDSDM